MYDYHYPGQELDLFRHASKWKKYIRRAIHPYLYGDVLEVGAGIGTNTFMLFSEHIRKWDCLEPDPMLIKHLRHSVSALDPSGNIHVIQGILSSLPEASRYHTILYIDVLEHIEDDSRELEAASRRLHQGGRLIVLAPAHPWLLSPFDRQIGHLRRYTRSSLLATAPPSLNKIRVRYLDSAGLTASLANRLVLKRSMPTVAHILFWDRLLIPCSILLDPFLGFCAGKSVLAIWQTG